MKQSELRESNFELLRIISMLFIVTYHFCYYAILPDKPADYLNIQRGVISVLHIGVICYILISGYWGIKFSLKGFIKLYVLCAFYSIAIYLFYSLINPEEFNLHDFIKSFFPIQWWFIQIYFCLYLISPILNTSLKTSNTQKKILLIVLLGIVSFVFGKFTTSLGDGKNPINFAFIYFIGNFLRNNIPHDLRSYKKQLLGGYILLNVIVFVSITFLGGRSSKIIFYLFYPYNSLGLILNASILFLLFTTFRIKSKAINWLAASALPIYLIHENKYIGRYLYGFVKHLDHTISDLSIFILVIIALGLIVCLSCILIDKIFSPIINKIVSLLVNNKFIQKTDNKIQCLLRD